MFEVGVLIGTYRKMLIEVRGSLKFKMADVQLEVHVSQLAGMRKSKLQWQMPCFRGERIHWHSGIGVQCKRKSEFQDGGNNIEVYVSAWVWLLHSATL